MLLQYRRPLQSRLMGERNSGTGGKPVEICHTCHTRLTRFIPLWSGGTLVPAAAGIAM